MLVCHSQTIQKTFVRYKYGGSVNFENSLRDRSEFAFGGFRLLQLFLLLGFTFQVVFIVGSRTVVKCKS